ncbi:hypothetical protein BaRGS_00028179 [Batillaria attramentaria]|uniref:Uncharacterized protein n=1 Tax=Batillaria attramentaria TaxID=370345 RepID=A0ABD0K0A2_9CAEN
MHYRTSCWTTRSRLLAPLILTVTVFFSNARVYSQTSCLEIGFIHNLNTSTEEKGAFYNPGITQDTYHTVTPVGTTVSTLVHDVQKVLICTSPPSGFFRTFAFDGTKSTSGFYGDPAFTIIVPNGSMVMVSFPHRILKRFVNVCETPGLV